MKLEIRLPAANEPLREHAEQRLFSCVGPLERTLDTLTVSVFTDEDGLHACRILARPLAGAVILMEAVAPNSFAAIDRVFALLAGRLERETTALVVHANNGGRKPQALRPAHAGAPHAQ